MLVQRVDQVVTAKVWPRLRVIREWWASVMRRAASSVKTSFLILLTDIYRNFKHVVQPRTELADATRPDVVDERKCVRRRTADACRQAFVFRVPI